MAKWLVDTSKMLYVGEKNREIFTVTPRMCWWNLFFRWTTNHCVSCALPFTLTEINCRLFDGNYEERAKQGIIASARMFELPIERGTSAFVGRLSPHLKTRGQEWTEGLMHFLCLSKPTFPYPTLSPSNSLSLFLGLEGLATSLTFRTLE